MDELLDVVDSSDNVIGQQWRSEVYKNRSKYTIRAVWFFIINDKGQLWIPRRTAQKKLCPNSLDGSSVGHIGAGETYEQALIREVQEELNIDLNKHSYKEIAYLPPKINHEKTFVKIYEFKSNDVPDYNRNDYCEYFWLTPHELLEKMKNDYAKSYLKIIMEDVFLNRKEFRLLNIEY